MVEFVAWAFYSLILLVMCMSFFKVLLLIPAFTVWRRGTLDKGGKLVAAFFVIEGILILCIVIPVWIFLHS